MRNRSYPYGSIFKTQYLRVTSGLKNFFRIYQVIFPKLKILLKLNTFSVFLDCFIIERLGYSGKRTTLL